MTSIGKKMFLTQNNIKKTMRYLKRNGLKNTFYALRERIAGSTMEAYRYQNPDPDTLSGQREKNFPYMPKFSILVPAYETKSEYMKQLIDSCLMQSYTEFEVIIADASSSDMVYTTVKQYTDSRIVYLKLDGNQGISGNSNQALCHVTGDYTGLLDHDDVLTPDALYFMAEAINQGLENNRTCQFLFSNEDKGNSEMDQLFEPHYKEKFNLDLIMSNNYICHFSVIKTSLLKELGFRSEYDGAQDYDLFLRIIDRLMPQTSQGFSIETDWIKQICHVDKILYHWRCHEESTAFNPQSKMYAYEAGRLCIEDFLKKRNIKASVLHTPHLGFYQVDYETSENLLEQRKEIAIIGGNVLKKGRILSGALNEKAQCPYYGLRQTDSGYMHRASLSQNCEGVDLRNAVVRPEFEEAFHKVLAEIEHTKDEKEIREKSLLFCKELTSNHYLVYFDKRFSTRT